MNEYDKYINYTVRIAFTDGSKGDNAHLGIIIWAGNKYIELRTEKGNELIPHKNIIRIEIVKDNRQGVPKV